MAMNFQPWASSFGSLSKIVLGLFDLGNLRELGDVQRAVLEGDAVRPVQARRNRLHRALAVLVGRDGIDVADQTRAHKDRALVALGKRSRIGDAGGKNLD